LVVLAAGAAIAIWAWSAPVATPPIAGMVRQTEIRIAPDATGRLGLLPVAPGQHVRKGDLLAVLDNPELAASLEEARAAAARARADRDHVYSGVRAEEVAIAAQSVRTAEANLLLAKKEYARIAALAKRDFAARQQLDESAASLASAQADLDLKRAQYEAARAGPTAEERALADAKVSLAEATVADLQARLDKTQLFAPADGAIGIQVAELGEVISPGQPVMTLEVEGERWFAFAMREDALLEVAIGRTIGLTTDDGRQVEARVSEMRPLGEFATWRAARAVGDHDLNSLWLRLEPVAQQPELQPGMAVWFSGRSRDGG
jgi:multidrug resistance efflux pump